MNDLGVSSACYYPQTTETALEKIIRDRFPFCEVFFNSFSELEPDFLAKMKEQADVSNLQIRAIHPFTSFAESFFLFSSYERRFHDTIPFFYSFFQAAKTLGATVFVLHGLIKPFTISETEYFRRFYLLAESAAQHGVSVCQENVVRFASEDPAFLARMSKAIGKEFGVVFDIKQARRANRDYREYLELIGDHIQHVHLSDYNTERDCIPPGEGEFDFSLFFGEMKSLGYKKAYMIELYRDSYENESQIADSYVYLKKLLR